ncbi:hypothetical protein AB0Y38_10430 [Lysinibacillus capsici]|uniref:hypothetical protein n=1 Tax=Lysinibacillus capsici TaxID=2115968 RepID=UPI003F205C77
MKVNHLHAGEAGAVYFFCVKVNDNASTETISVERLIATIIASKIVKGINSFLFHKLNEIG